jgi:hypothetical protein
MHLATLRLIVRMLARICLVILFSLGAALGETPPTETENMPDATPTATPDPYVVAGQGIIVRTTENVTNGGWIYLLSQCHEHGINRIDLLVKQDEDNFKSARTGQTLQSGELLVPLPNEKTAAGWENADWLKEMLARAKEMNIKIFAWFPCFHDSQVAAEFPDAAYKGQRGEVFVDAADPRVQYRIEDLLAKLLNTYAFDGVSLDWVRYSGWWEGSDKITGFRFEHLMHFKWGHMTLESDYNKARWYEFRATAIADWVARVQHNFHEQRPNVRFGAFLLPPEFTEQSQNYPMLERSGLDFIQPMGYWPDWKKPPQWLGENIVGPYSKYLTNGASFWPAIGIDAQPQEIVTSLKSLPADAVRGLSFFTYGTWEQHTFDKLAQIVKTTPEAQRLFGYPQPTPAPLALASPSPTVRGSAEQPPPRIQPKDFPADSSVWSIICLGELYRRGALKDPNADPVCPVLAFHTFADVTPGTQSILYKCSTQYLDAVLNALASAGFNVIPLSRLQSYTITGDPAFLPPRPLVITIDDGSESVVKLFHPRAVKRKMPYTIALVTSWMSETDESSHSTGEPSGPDPTMTWKEAKQLYDSGLVEVISHSDGLHYQAIDLPLSDEGLPAETTRQWLKEKNRLETTAEYEQRIRIDMDTSRRKLAEHGFPIPSFFCWPYGEWNLAAKMIAKTCGFTHFLGFDTPAIFVSRDTSADGNLPRIPVYRKDESVPLNFPNDKAEQQGWWLAFLRVGIRTQSRTMLSATLAQLTPEAAANPLAEISRGAIEILNGNVSLGTDRLMKLRTASAFDANVTTYIDQTLALLAPPPRPH